MVPESESTHVILTCTIAIHDHLGVPDLIKHLVRYTDLTHIIPLNLRCYAASKPFGTVHRVSVMDIP